MVASIQKIIDLNPATIIPGHGVVLHDLEYLWLVKEAYETYIKEAENAAKNKIPISEAREYIKQDDLDYKFTQGDDLKKWAFRSFFKGKVITQVYQKMGALPKK